MGIGFTLTAGAGKTAIRAFEHRTQDAQVKGGTLQEGSTDKNFKGLPECGFGVEFQLAHFHDDFADLAGEDVLLLGGSCQGFNDILNYRVFMHRTIINQLTG